MAKKTAKKSKPSKMVYYFGKTKTEGEGVSKSILGGKGLNLADMTSIGLPVPPGMTITTQVCADYYKNGKKLPKGLMDEINDAISTLEKELGKKFGDNKNPLLVSVRSGAAVSMPGMMNTILNLGLTDESVVGLANATNNERFAYDAYRRLIDMFGDVVMEVDREHFEEAFSSIKKKYKANLDNEVPAEGLIELCNEYKAIYQKYTGESFPQDPLKQLELAVEAVFKSWNTTRAVRYREVEGIRGLLGTAVNVQSMAYGNMGQDSGTGVAFTRNPSTGENKFYGEFLIDAQGEDVVAGIRTPQPVSEMSKWNKAVYKQLLEIKDTLEAHYKDVQDIEFTIEKGELFMLQTRNGKRTGAAAVKIACDMVKEGLIDEETALLRIPANDLTQLLLPSFTAESKKGATILTRGLPASPGAAVGALAFTAEEAVDRTHSGEKVILCRKETSPEDIDGMHSAVGILTSTGGMTSHAAVVARGWGRCCVAGAGEIEIDEKGRKIKVGGKTFKHSDIISIDGSTGEVMAGTVETSEPKLSGDFAKVMKWADNHRTLGVRTNADTPKDSQRARDFGAEGIGLCRTEHMFFEEDRITSMREMILAETEADRRAALAKLLPYQREDFVGIFTAMKNLPVTVRLLDPPLHEFLPHDPKAQKEMADTLGVSPAKVKSRVAALHEANPMLGHRGCRLSVTYPEILEMQVTAIVEAAIECKKNRINCMPEIMIPLVGTAAELQLLRAKAEETIEKAKADKGYSGQLDILIGTMIEIPRAALTADEVAEHAEFFSFGTNDLTQMTFGYSRDDVNTFLPDYTRLEILPTDPFQSLDTTGVGQLVEMGVTKGRKGRKGLKCGICGEHGGDPASINFCHTVGLDYVSCSPFRVPIARLAAAQAAIRNKKK
ncbi:pyruvate, phosphate dikinase [Blastopirellula marina]|uniref:Pyruvate, phosphate dikinase n=1 Tax=Blastopirellula marina TaxID=124 RepID=A0A2S8F734_9BACT|nr:MULTISPECIES: pyruvate, phosphate dikinase [Pirellulaceae]PQO27969.1 pyruvate, phosphate dikinase [Blastopirellula marina]RCS48394.1 pyruvate, phosphate dikinase [Bremerella cremea]